MKNLFSLYSSSPFIAMLKNNIRFVEFGGRIATGGMPIILYKRAKTYKLVPVTTLIAIGIYEALLYFSHTVEGTNAQLTLSIGEGIMVFAPGVLLVVLSSFPAFMTEPLWLNLSAMTPIEFARNYLIARTIPTFIVFLPISISVLLINPLVGVGSLFIPLLYIYSASINARVYFVFVSSRHPYYNSNTYVGLLLLPLVQVALDSFFPIAGVVVTMASTLPFLFSRSYWEKTFEKALTSV